MGEAMSISQHLVEHAILGVSASASGDDPRIMHSLQIKGDCNGGPPLIGTFAFGDAYRDITPLVSGFLYWQCIQSGVDTSSVWSGVGNVTLQHIDTNFSPSSNIVNGGVYTKTYTIVKSSVGDRVLLGFNTTYNMTDISLIGDVTSADTVTATVTNNTGSTVNITPGSMLIRVIK